MSAPTLIASYDAAVEALLAEVAATQAGDRIVLAVYILEPGESSERVLAALRDAALRDVHVSISVDATAASQLSRVVERTRTLLPRAQALARELPARVVATPLRSSDHSKYAIFQRAAGTPSALLGGINLGDRFRPWRDFMVRVEGAGAVDRLVRTLAGDDDAGCSDFRFVANVPAHELWAVRPTFEALAVDPRFRRYRMAMAYLDHTGARVLRSLLDRDAELELVLPAQANVYQHANMRALDTLLRGGGSLRVQLSRAMVHAKVLLAEGEEAGAAFLGSANLKRNSLVRFGELNVLVHTPAFRTALGRELDRLLEQCQPLEGRPRFNRARAIVEERLG